MKDTELLNRLTAANAVILGGHIVYTSGRHGGDYVNCRVLNLPEHRDALEQIACTLVEDTMREACIDLDHPITVVGPETLGAVLARVGATQYTRKHDIRITPLTFEPIRYEGGKAFKWKGGVDPVEQLRGAQVIYIDDLMTTSSTLERCRPLIEKYVQINAIGVIIDRSGLSATELRIPSYTSMAQLDMKSFEADACPLCAAKQPIVRNLGHGNNFERAHPNYPGGFIDI